MTCYQPQTLWNGPIALRVQGSQLAPTITVFQLKLELAAQGLMDIVTNGISADPSDPANIQWFTSTYTTYNDALYLSIINTLSYTPAQVNALYIAAFALGD